jgi:hypothetical protein
MRVLMVAFLALQAMLLTEQAQATATPSPLASLCAEKPPVPARIEGQIVSLRGTPVANVEVWAFHAVTGREYTTKSDQRGRYVVTGFDADSKVELIFRDARRHVAVGCAVRPSASEPSVTVDTVIDERPGPEVFPGLGCRREAASWDTWVGDDSTGWGGGLANSAKAPPRDAALPRLALRSSDIAEVRMIDEAAVLRLTPSAAEALRAFTKANFAKMTLTTIDGEPAVRSVAAEIVESGVMTIPGDFLRGKRVCAILGHLSRQQ